MPISFSPLLNEGFNDSILELLSKIYLPDKIQIKPNLFKIFSYRNANFHSLLMQELTASEKELENFNEEKGQ